MTQSVCDAAPRQSEAHPLMKTHYTNVAFYAGRYPCNLNLLPPPPELMYRCSSAAAPWQQGRGFLIAKSAHHAKTHTHTENPVCVLVAPINRPKEIVHSGLQFHYSLKRCGVSWREGIPLSRSLEWLSTRRKKKTATAEEKQDTPPHCSCLSVGQRR